MIIMIKNLELYIVCIRYNILNLPDTVLFKNGHQIINKYDASGKKLSDQYYTLLYDVQVSIAVGKVLNIKNSYGSDEVDLIKKYYVDNFTYKWHIMNQSSGGYDLEKVYNTEGYVDNISLSNRNNYFRKDHLGTNREVWGDIYKNFIEIEIVRCDLIKPAGQSSYKNAYYEEQRTGNNINTAITGVGLIFDLLRLIR